MSGRCISSNRPPPGNVRKYEVNPLRSFSYFGFDRASKYFSLKVRISSMSTAQIATWSSFIGFGGQETTLFHYLLLETPDKPDHFALFSLGHLELRECRRGMPQEHIPVALADTHASVTERHVPTPVVHRPARAATEEVDQELLLAHDAVLSAMRPKAAELRIGSESRQEIIRHPRDRVVATQ